MSESRWLATGNFFTSYKAEQRIFLTHIDRLVFLCFLAALFVWPLIFEVSNKYMLVIDSILIAIVAVYGLNLLTGFAGLISIGHAAFVGVGAYTLPTFARVLGTNHVLLTHYWPLMIVAAGLVGAALRRAPAMAETGTDPFCHPEIRDWMTFTTEPAYARGVALVAGVISRDGCEAIGPIVRPLGDDPWPVGHFHGAAFSYRPLRKGRVDLVDTVRALFEEEMLNGILDLINDTRPIVGVGQSQFVRGTCWMAPVSNMERVMN